MLLSKLQSGALRTIAVPIDSIGDVVHIRQLSVTALKELQAIEDKDEQSLQILLRTVTDENGTQLTKEMLDEIREQNSPDLLTDFYKAFAEVNVAKEMAEGED